MSRLARDLCLLSLWVATLAVIAGCDGSSGEPNAPPVPAGAAAGGGGMPSGGPGPGGPAGKTASNPEIRKIMTRLSGASALGTLIGQVLKAESPAWDTIQPEAKEYAQLASDMAKQEPAKGSKDSWAKLSAKFAELASELDKAARPKTKRRRPPPMRILRHPAWHATANTAPGQAAG